jgi:hypothetical protein
MSWSAWMSIQDVPHRGGTLAKAPSKRHPLLAAPFALAVWIRRVPLMRDASHIAIRSTPPVPWVSGFWGGQDVKCFQARSPVRGVASLSRGRRLPERLVVIKDRYLPPVISPKKKCRRIARDSFKPTNFQNEARPKPPVVTTSRMAPLAGSMHPGSQLRIDPLGYCIQPPGVTRSAP